MSKSPRAGTAKANGKLIRELREAKGWRPEDLAKKAGISKGTVENIERGNGVFLSSIKRVSEALDLKDLAQLIERGSPPVENKSQPSLTNVTITMRVSVDEAFAVNLVETIGSKLSNPSWILIKKAGRRDAELPHEKVSTSKAFTPIGGLFVADSPPRPVFLSQPLGAVALGVIELGMTDHDAKDLMQLGSEGHLNNLDILEIRASFARNWQVVVLREEDESRSACNLPSINITLDYSMDATDFFSQSDIEKGLFGDSSGWNSSPR